MHASDSTVVELGSRMKKGFRFADLKVYGFADSKGCGFCMIIFAISFNPHKKNPTCHRL